MNACQSEKYLQMTLNEHPSIEPSFSREDLKLGVLGFKQHKKKRFMTRIGSERKQIVNPTSSSFLIIENDGD